MPEGKLNRSSRIERTPLEKRQKDKRDMIKFLVILAVIYFIGYLFNCFWITFIISMFGVFFGPIGVLIFPVLYIIIHVLLISQ